MRLILIFSIIFISLAQISAIELKETRGVDNYYYTQVNNKVGLIKKDGTVFISTEYDEISQIWNCFRLKKNNKFGFYCSEKLQIPVEYNSIEVFKYTKAANYYKVKKDNKFGIVKVDKELNKVQAIFEPKYDDIVKIESDLFALKLNNKFALANEKDKNNLKFIYSDVKTSIGLAKVKKGSIWYYKEPYKLAYKVPMQIYDKTSSVIKDLYTFVMWHTGAYN